MVKQHDRAIALAGICQSALWVHKLATGSTIDPDTAKCLVNSLFVNDPKTTSEVYSNQIEALSEGGNFIAHLANRASSKSKRHIFQYVIGMCYLSHRLASSDQLQTELDTRLKRAEIQMNMFGADHHQLFLSLASTYTDLFSNSHYRIRVAGSGQLLSAQSVQAQIRTALLCGIRSGILWKQLGGRQWHFILKKVEMRSAAAHIFTRETAEVD